MPYGKNCSVFDDVSRSLSVCSCVCVVKMWHEQDVTMLTLSSDTVTPISDLLQAEAACETVRDKQKERKLPEDGLQL